MQLDAQSGFFKSFYSLRDSRFGVGVYITQIDQLQSSQPASLVKTSLEIISGMTRQAIDSCDDKIRLFHEF